MGIVADLTPEECLSLSPLRSWRAFDPGLTEGVRHELRCRSVSKRHYSFETMTTPHPGTTTSPKDTSSVP